MNIKAKIVIMSHLSDAQEEISMGYATNGTLFHINFIKYLILHCGDDLDQMIDPDYMYQMFQESLPNKI
jgi:hypothetical protein